MQEGPIIQACLMGWLLGKKKGFRVKGLGFFKKPSATKVIGMASSYTIQAPVYFAYVIKFYTLNPRSKSNSVQAFSMHILLYR